MRKPPRIRQLIAAAGACLLAAGCGGSSSASGGGKLSLVAYSTPQEAYEKIIPAFQQTPAGKGIKFTQSYGASGDQARAVASGLPADVVALSLEPDVGKLVDAGLVAPSWNRDRYHGFVTDSVVVLAVRKGNPEHIESWDDLVRPGIEVITPNPFSSGGARWNIMAAYGAQLEQGKSPQQAQAYLQTLLEHVSVQDKSGREALQTFTAGKGDVLITYENEAIGAQQKGQSLDYVIPDQTILIENPVAVVEKGGNEEAAKAFVDFLHSDEAQRIFASKGYRPVKPELVDEHEFPTPPGLFKIDDLGGWSTVNEKFFDEQNGIVTKIEQGLGVSTAKG
ncbi:MAG: sulfate ABC transporter substrate-binding protein [Thermoleophilaceae bacterium]|nr:sulfate ABC transporter substrate-binding protein [Thermoleophilaceae bacterium]